MIKPSAVLIKKWNMQNQAFVKINQPVSSSVTDRSGEVQASIDTAVHRHFPTRVLYSGQLQLVLWLVVIGHVHRLSLFRHHTSGVSSVGHDELLPTNKSNYSCGATVWTWLNNRREKLINQTMHMVMWPIPNTTYFKCQSIRLRKNLFT